LRQSLDWLLPGRTFLQVKVPIATVAIYLGPKPVQLLATEPVDDPHKRPVAKYRELKRPDPEHRLAKARAEAIALRMIALERGIVPPPHRTSAIVPPPAVPSELLWRWSEETDPGHSPWDSIPDFHDYPQDSKAEECWVPLRHGWLWMHYWWIWKCWSNQKVWCTEPQELVDWIETLETYDGGYADSDLAGQLSHEELMAWHEAHREELPNATRSDVSQSDEGDTDL